VGVRFSCPSSSSSSNNHYYHPDCYYLPSSRHLTPLHPSPFTPPLVPSHRRLDKGSSSVGRGLGVTPPWICSTGGSKRAVSLLPRAVRVLSSLPTRARSPSLAFPPSSSLSFYLVPSAAGSAEGIQSEGKAGREIKT